MGSIIHPIAQHCEKTPNKIAIQEKDRSRTYAQLMENARKVAMGLKNMELPNKRVAVLSQNRIEYIEVILGAIYAGHVPLLLDAKWSKQEIMDVLLSSGVGIVFGDVSVLENISSASVHKQISFQRHSNGTFYEDWLQQQQIANEQTDHELLFIGYTSGTTGVPKGYKRTHDSWISSFKASVDAFGINKGDHFIAPGGFAHSLSLFVLIQSLYLGATFHILSKFNSKKIQVLCSGLSNVVLFVVPTMIQSLLSELRGPLHMKALISSGSQWTMEMKAEVVEQFDCARMYEFYGLSEASYISYTSVQKNAKIQPAQKIFPEVSVKVVDEHGKKVENGQIGQICVKSEMLFQGYDRRPGETKHVFQDGWLLSGDYGYLDEMAWLHLAGRQKNMLITGGLNVYPEEIEMVIKRLSVVGDVMVFGEKDEHLGEKIVAVIAWKNGHAQPVNKVRKFCAQYLATYKIPREIITVKEFLYTGSGKIARKEMINMVENGNE